MGSLIQPQVKYANFILTLRCSANTLLGGIIYLHDITIQRPVFAPAWPIGYLNRPEPAGHVLLTTGNWDRMTDVDERAANVREEQLKTSAWKAVVNGGAKTGRFLNTHDSAWMAVETLLNLDPLKLHVLQKELERCASFARKVPKRRPPRKGFFSFLFGLFGRSQVCIPSYSLAHITQVYLGCPEISNPC